jgi:hypothetical protein
MTASEDGAPFVPAETGRVGGRHWPAIFALKILPPEAPTAPPRHAAPMAPVHPPPQGAPPDRGATRGPGPQARSTAPGFRMQSGSSAALIARIALSLPGSP